MSALTEDVQPELSPHDPVLLNTPRRLASTRANFQSDEPEGATAAERIVMRPTIRARDPAIGIALFIQLPPMRLILMSGVFPHQLNVRFSAIDAFLPAIVAAGEPVGAT